MPREPLQPFAPPSGAIFDQFRELFGGAFSSLPLLILSIIFLFWAVYTLVAVYHWIKYSHAALIALPAIGVHLFISLAFISYALSGALFI